LGASAGIASMAAFHYHDWAVVFGASLVWLATVLYRAFGDKWETD
jgi:hypothetical protein